MARTLLGGSPNVLHSVHRHRAGHWGVYLGPVRLSVSEKSQRPHLTLELGSAIQVLLLPGPQQAWVLPPQRLRAQKQPQPGQPHLPATGLPGAGKFLSKEIQLPGFDVPPISSESPPSRGNGQPRDDPPCCLLAPRPRFSQPGPPRLPLVQRQPASGPVAATTAHLRVHHKGVPGLLKGASTFNVFLSFLAFSWKEVVNRLTRILRAGPQPPVSSQT